MSTVIALKTTEDYVTGLLKSYLTEVVDAATIPVNSYAFNGTLNALRVNDGSNTVRSAVDIDLGVLEIGDKIEFNYEFMSLSGTKPKMIISYADGSELLNIACEKQGVFEIKNGSCFVTKKQNVKIALGLFTADIGDFYLRNVAIKVNKGIATPRFSKSNRMYNFYTHNGSVEVLATTGDTCTVTIDNTAMTMTVAHSKPFGKLNGYAIAEADASSNGKIRVLTRTATTNGFVMKFYDTSTQTYVAPSSLAYFYFGAIQFGYDKNF